MQNVITEIERVFVSRNYPANVVTRHVDGIAGQQPQLGLVTLNPKSDGTATKAEQDRLNAMLADFRDWWDNSGAWLAVRQAVFNAVWSGRGTVRLFVPRSKLQDIGRRDDQTVVMGIPAGLDLPGALKFLSCHAPAWDQAGLVRGIDDRIQAAYYRYLDENEKERWELQERRDGQTVVYNYLKGRRIPLPSDYDGNSTGNWGGALIGGWLQWIHDRYPEDFQQIKRYYPHVEAALLRDLSHRSRRG